MSLYVNLPFLYTDNKVAVSSNAGLPHSYWLSNLDSRSCRKWESVKFWGAGAHSQGNSYAYAMAFLKTGLSVSKAHFRVPGFPPRVKNGIKVLLRTCAQSTKKWTTYYQSLNQCWFSWLFLPVCFANCYGSLVVQALPRAGLVFCQKNSDTQSTRGWVTTTLLPPSFYLSEHMSLRQKSRGVSWHLI